MSRGSQIWPPCCRKPAIERTSTAGVWMLRSAPGQFVLDLGEAYTARSVRGANWVILRREEAMNSLIRRHQCSLAAAVAAESVQRRRDDPASSHVPQESHPLMTPFAPLELSPIPSLATPSEHRTRGHCICRPSLEPTIPFDQQGHAALAATSEKALTASSLPATWCMASGTNNTTSEGKEWGVLRALPHHMRLRVLCGGIVLVAVVVSRLVTTLPRPAGHTSPRGRLYPPRMLC